MSTFSSIWSKIIILHAPTLRDTSAEMQEEVDEVVLKIDRVGPKCVLYNLSYARLFDNWESIRAESQRWNIWEAFIREKWKYIGSPPPPQFNEDW